MAASRSVNLLGCVAFGIAAVASFFVPSHGSVVNLAATNLFTSLGGLCFLDRRDHAASGGLVRAFTHSG